MDRERKWPGVQSVSKSSIQIEFVYNTIRCRERIKLKPTPANLKRAHQHRSAILDSIARGTFNYKSTFPNSPNAALFAEFKGDCYLLRDYLADWLIKKEKQLHSSTFDDYRKTVNNVLIPEFGDKAISELTLLDITEWCSKQKSGNKRLSNIQSVLRTALQDAKGGSLIATNVLYGYTYKILEAPKDEDNEDEDGYVDPFTIEEQQSILANCRFPQHKNMFEFMFWTGLRTSELVALQWKDINFENGTVRISKAKTQKSEKAEKPKTKSGARLVKLLPPAIEALKAQKEHSFLAGGAVFLNHFDNQPWRGDRRIRENAWIPALKKAGVRYRNPYQTRHTYASMMLTADESPTWLKGQMGHSDTSMIFRIYAKWIVTKDDNSGMKAVKMFSKTTKKKVA